MKQKSEPKYISIYRALRAQILFSDTPAAKLPPENQLMAHFGVSRTTIRKATQLLKDEHIIESHKGSGTDINQNVRVDNGDRAHRVTSITRAAFSLATDDIRSRQHSEMLVDTVPAILEVAQALRLQPGENVYRIRWLHYVNDIPYLYLINYVRMDLAPNLEDAVRGRDSLYPALADAYGLIYEEGQETVEPVSADFITAKLLDVPVGSPLFLITRTAKFNRGYAECSRRYLRPDQYRLTLYLK